MVLLLWQGFTKFIAAISAGSNCYIQITENLITLQNTLKFTFVVKTWFQEQGNDVHDGLVNPNRQATSILNSTAATWLHTSP